jgi:hypothetical protein
MKIIRFILLLTLFSCQGKEKAFNTLSSSDSIKEDSLRFLKLIEASIDLPALQQYYKVQETLKQEELVILENEILKEIRNLSKFNQPVRILNTKKIQEDRIKAYLDFKSIKITNDTAFVYYSYDIQGIGIKSTYLYQDSSWILLDFDLWEN